MAMAAVTPGKAPTTMPAMVPATMATMFFQARTAGRAVRM